MELPFFYTETTGDAHTLITLDEDTSKHIVQVLRMKVDEQLLLTDGKGNLFTCVITDNHKKRCVVKIKDARYKEQDTRYKEQGARDEAQDTRHKIQRVRKISIAISLLKNTNRFEWFLEKATELGVTEIIPLLCERTEKLRFRYDRMKNILISAMLQSQQVWIPELKEPVAFIEIVSKSHHAQKFIAHCADDAKVDLAEAINSTTDSQVILIGPEGDFTKNEIELAMKYHFVAVTLGETRLRTETAGIVAATLLTR